MKRRGITLCVAKNSKVKNLTQNKMLSLHRKAKKKSAHTNYMVMMRQYRIPKMMTNIDLIAFSFSASHKSFLTFEKWMYAYMKMYPSAQIFADDK